MTTALTLPMPLSSRLFHTQQAIEIYNQQVADYYAQVEEAERNSKTPTRNKQPSRRERYEEQN
ncbi:MAG: hypothetical protein Q7K57_37450 [Burkholderiaceae bacterium]|nr:hypothetical protein [Burkholderiaceae bacterium]